MFISVEENKKSLLKNKKKSLFIVPCLQITNIFKSIVKDLGFGNRKVIWKFTEMFNVQKYIEENWFVSTLEMDNAYFDEMTKAKDLYISRRISFLEYFFKRLDVYNSIEASKHHKYYKNVDMIKYKDNLRKIFKDLPSMTKEGEFDI